MLFKQVIRHGAGYSDFDSRPRNSFFKLIFRAAVKPFWVDFTKVLIGSQLLTQYRLTHSLSIKLFSIASSLHSLTT